MQPAQSPGRFLIPHHCVPKIEGGKTKLRVVFDAFCSSRTGLLNDYLMVGPKLQKDIVEILLKFRTHTVVLVADIVKMYRQILVRPEDRTYQHILWRSHPGEQIQEMELNTVTDGESSAPYLAIRFLVQLTRDGHRYPHAARILLDSVSVDDIVTGADSLKDANLLLRDIISLLKLGELELSKWKSNRQELLDCVLETSDDKDVSLSRMEDGCKILGLQWNFTSDELHFVVHLSSSHTKRGILSTIARIYYHCASRGLMLRNFVSHCSGESIISLFIYYPVRPGLVIILLYYII